MKIRKKGVEEKIELQMTPMIDIVFQLLVFFIMTFKIVAMEGDFNIKMPLTAPKEGTPEDIEDVPMRLMLRADAKGELSSIKIDQKSFEDMDALHNYIRGELGDDPDARQSQTEVELDCDYQLDYKYVIAAITAITGRVDESGQVVKLVEKIKFSPPRGGPTK
jgi:biopolymer transport protein ExbD